MKLSNPHILTSSHPHIPLRLVEEGSRVLHICNACRYCEGFCAVFPAMERRSRFLAPDLTYLANLCHDCGECYEACQYAPPHEFLVNLPKTLAEIRRETYRTYAWPAAFGGLITRHATSLLLTVVALPLLCFLTLRVVVGGAVLFQPYSTADGSFYQVVPHSWMIGIFGAAGALAAVALIAGVVRFWRDTDGTRDFGLTLSALSRAVSESLTLRYLDGGGEGCVSGNRRSAFAETTADKWATRRTFHHLTFYGFMLCFAATSVAAFYHHVLAWKAPYPVLSVPVVLGSVGGLGLLVGPSGLLWLKRRGDSETSDRAQKGMDVTFLLVLLATSATGFLLLVLRESSAMGTLLAVHLGIVLGLFVTMPYGKFVHGIYRFAALVRNAMESGGRGTGIGDRGSKKRI